MPAKTIRAVLQDEPRPGQMLPLDAGPPAQVVVSDPLAMQRPEESLDLGTRPVAATT
jgi:hypothetical protein